MSKTKLFSLTAGAAFLLGNLLITSCASTTDAPDGVAPLPKSPAEMWEDNCGRCHNFRDPGSLDDAQWKVAMHHMRVRANLTAEEAEGILKFLQASN